MPICQIFWIIIGIISFICNILYVVFYRHYYSSEAVRILFYISFGLIFLIYLFMIFMYLPIRNKTINKFRRMCSKNKIFIGIILFIIAQFEMIILIFILRYIDKFWLNCPFTITDDFNLHYKRRCELYSINNNSRFANQYICSYNPYEDFAYKFKSETKKIEKQIQKKIKPDFVRCIKVNKLIPDNKIITLFNNEYKNNYKYYCSRTNRPKKNSLINDKDCNNKFKKSFSIILYVIIYLKMFFFISFICYLKTDIDYDIYGCDINYNDRSNNHNSNTNNSNNNNNLYNANNELSSTKISEDINKTNISSIGFANQETKIIIIENKKEIPLKDKIGDYPYGSETDIKNDNLDISKKSSPDIKNNEAQNNIQHGAKAENPKQSQGGNTNPNDEVHDDKN